MLQLNQQLLYAEAGLSKYRTLNVAYAERMKGPGYIPLGVQTRVIGLFGLNETLKDMGMPDRCFG